MIDFLSRAFGGDKPDKPTAKKRINLALQGGGAHGAFTWGVLDHLLEDGRLTVEGISGTSAGAVNAVMLADGLRRGGAEEARKRLADFWRAASLGGDLPPLQRAVLEPAVLAGAERGLADLQLAERPGRNIFRPTISIRSTSIRSRI